MSPLIQMSVTPVASRSGEGFVPLPIVGERPKVSELEARHGLRNVLIVAFVAAVALLPIIIAGIPNGADLPNHLRFGLPFYDAVHSAHFHPGWLAESNYGLGDPRFRFYPPGFYYLLALARMLTGSWYAGTIAALVLLSVTGALGVYSWARTICEPGIAIWAGLLYALAPYRLNEIYQASLFSEYAACSILPFAFAFVERICRRKSKYDVVGLGAVYALLIITHLPMALIGSISLGIYVLLRIERKHLLSTLARLASGVALGLAASSFFWTTMLAELSWIKGNGTQPSIYYDYRVNFLFSPLALANRNTWYANLLALVVIGFMLPAVVLISRRFMKGSSHPALLPVLVLAAVSFLMGTELSRPIWAIVPKLSEVQFPWRWLSITSLMGSIVVAASIPKWKEMFRTKVRPRDLAVALAFVLSLVFVATQVIREAEYTNQAKFEAMAQDVRGAASFKDWLPVWARDFMNVERMNAKVDAGTRSVTIHAWEPERRAFHLGAGPENLLRVRTYFYPHWIARADGRVLPTTATADGLLQISAPPQGADIELVFQEPARVHLFELVTAASWILVIAAFAWSVIRQRDFSLPGRRDRFLTPATPRN